MNSQNVKQVVIIDEIVRKFYELQREIFPENSNSEYNFNKDVDTIRDMFCKVSNLYIDREIQSRVLQLNSEINDYKAILEKLEGFKFENKPFCQDLYDGLINQLKLELEYREKELSEL